MTVRAIVVALCALASTGCQPDIYRPPPCDDDTADFRACGLNGRGRICTGGATSDAWSNCEDPDECVDGTTRVASCEGGDFGGREQTCVEGHFVSGECHPLSLSAGGYHTCSLQAEGPAVCWGADRWEQLGTVESWESHERLVSEVPLAINDEEIERPIAFAAGGYHTCLLRGIGADDKRVLCWGQNSYGQLGVGYVGSPLYNRPTYVLGLSRAVAIGAGLVHTCAVLDDGAVECWGLSTDGRLGNGETTGDFPDPVPVVDFEGAVAVDAGLSHTCAVRADGTVACWGSNELGQLGDGLGGEGALSATPVEVAGLTDAVEVRAGGASSCARREGGSVVCWGSHVLVPGAVSALTPVPIEGIEDAVALTLGNGFACALGASGEVRCWGSSIFGLLGPDAVGGGEAPSPPIAGLEAMAISAGIDHVCALRRSGEAVCWGRGDLGQIGNGSLEHASAPVAVTPYVEPGCPEGTYCDSDLGEYIVE